MSRLIQYGDHSMPGASMPTSDERTLDTHLPDAFEYFPDALILADGEARISYLNPAAERLLGLSLGKARGHLLDKRERGGGIALHDGRALSCCALSGKRHCFFGDETILRCGMALTRACPNSRGCRQGAGVRQWGF
ncbi:MAG: hypothetical protein B7Y31_03545 [Novosphingobium sp. 16-62-11]|nr:MAG: hypothetical protein B7Y31_03545 [Novosphingobium sp. 16-62-11]